MIPRDILRQRPPLRIYEIVPVLNVQHTIARVAEGNDYEKQIGLVPVRDRLINDSR